MSEGTPAQANYHFATVDASKTWWKTFPGHQYYGYLARIRGLVTVGLAEVAGLVFAFFRDPHLALILTALAAVSFFLLVIIRMVLTQSCHSDAALHELMHLIRDQAQAVFRASTPELRNAEIRRFHEQVVQDIADYFRLRTGNSLLDCVIRLGFVEDRTNRKGFQTIGRSNGLSRGRDQSSEPIWLNEGIARAFDERGGEGAYVINDMGEAIASGLWKLTQNTRKYPEIKRVLVCPINGYGPQAQMITVNGRTVAQKEMLGFLLLTSKSHPIPEVLWLAQSAIADLLGFVFPLFYTPPFGPGEKPTAAPNHK